jgi:hypothetical protein
MHPAQNVLPPAQLELNHTSPASSLPDYDGKLIGAILREIVLHLNHLEVDLRLRSATIHAFKLLKRNTRIACELCSA